MLKLNFEKSKYEEKVKNYFSEAEEIHKKLKEGNIDFTGWVNLPENYDREEFKKIVEVASEIKENAEILIVIGIGGSYLGARAAIEYLSGYYKKYKKDESVRVIFAGNGLSERYLKETLDFVKDKEIYVNVISKSGGTLEPAVAFNQFKEILNSKYSKEEVKKRIIVTTDKSKGILKEEADREGYRTFVVPDDIGGRYSVLSAVGLLPIATAGYNIEKLLKGALNIKNKFEKEKDNDAYKYAILRNIYYKNGKDIEVFSTFSPNMRMFEEWLKQLFGESECKEHKGIFPASLLMTADLHSMGQLMQEGKRNIFETFIMISDDYIEKERLKYNEKYFVNDLNDIALRATEKAHFDGDVPVIEIKANKQDEETLGELFYFFMLSCAISAMILKVNPFNQPGVEEYKKNIKELL